MKPLHEYNPEEEHLRQQILSHEFEFVPASWEKMNTLLEKNITAKTGSPASDSTTPTQIGPSRHVIAWASALLILLFTNHYSTTQSGLQPPLPSQEQIELAPAHALSEAAQLTDASKVYIGRPSPTPTHSTAHSAASDNIVAAYPANTVSAIQTDTSASPRRPDKQLSTPTVPQAAPLLIYDLKRKIRPNPQIKAIKDSPIHFGWLGGGSLTTTAYYPLRTSLQPIAGLVVRKNISPGIDIQAELSVRRAKGFDYAIQLSGSEYNQQYNQVIKWQQSWTARDMVFFELPLLLRFQTGAERWHWLAGMRTTWNQPVNREYTEYCQCGDAPEPAPKIDFNKAFRHLNGGLVVGAEVKLNNRLYLDFRYNQGLADLSKDSYFRDKKLHMNSDIEFTIRHFWK